MCPICHKENETVEHVLLLCGWTELVWFGLGISPMPTPFFVIRFDGWLFDCLENCPKEDMEELRALLFYTCWSVRKARNELVFDEKKPNPTRTLIISRTHCYEFLKGQRVPESIAQVHLNGGFAKS